MVVQGFDDGVNTVWDGVKGMHQTIKTLYEEKGKNRKLFITGHSLGGALATIAAARLAFVDDMNIAGIYTIGSPRYCGSSIVRVLAFFSERCSLVEVHLAVFSTKTQMA